MKTTSILVAGASGLLGHEICRQLVAKNQSVKALVRAATDPGKIDLLKNLGVQVVTADLGSRDELAGVLQGVTTVISTISSMPFSYKPGENDIQSVDENGVINLIDAAKSAGVRHFIYTSFSSNLNLDFPLNQAKRKVEGYLQESGLTYTILRPSCFMELWLTAGVGFDAVNGKVTVCGTGTKPLAYISYKDVATFAVESVSNHFAKNMALELGGPQNISQLVAVKIFEEELKRKIEIQHNPVEVLRAQMEGSADPMQKSFAGLMLCVAQGDVIDMANLLVYFPVKLTSVRQYASSTAQH